MTIVATLDAVARALPAGYRARPFRDEDREAIVAERNADLPEVEHESAAEWREWERSTPDPTRVRVVVDAASGAYAGNMDVGQGGLLRAPDGSARAGVFVARAHRRLGLGGALVAAVESAARDMAAPKLHGGVSAREPEALAWAQKRGYREIGRRIQAAVDLDRFDPARWRERARRPLESGVRFTTLEQLKREMDAERLEAFLHRVYDVETVTWADIPVATPLAHWGYDVFRRLLLEQRGSAPDLDVFALDGDTVVGLTSSFRGEGGRKGGTGYTAVLPAYRGRGIAFALKIEALTRAKTSGMRWMITTNDEPNKAMRAVNYTLGYEPLPAHIQLEKTL
ncbi:MAG: GNAT family N-acetyltransferase [Chloroflexota bacterium]|nr:GNAT family N-acetyltransferase [Chloroflexota bacterium]MDE3192737.1 GNAT family N-acetyltransferase [Chloroflexota bacterium]